MILRPPRSTRTDTLFPYTTLFRSLVQLGHKLGISERRALGRRFAAAVEHRHEQDNRKQYPDPQRKAAQPRICGLVGGLAHLILRLLPLCSPINRAKAFTDNVWSDDYRPGEAERSEERRVGKGCVSPCVSRWWPYH